MRGKAVKIFPLNRNTLKSYDGPETEALERLSGLLSPLAAAMTGIVGIKINPFLAKLLFNPLTADAVHIRYLHFLSAITYQLLKMLKIKSDNNQQDLKFVDLHFVKSE